MIDAETIAVFRKQNSLPMEPVRLALAFPPSINALWRVVKGRSIMSADYRAWIEEAGMELILQKPRKLTGRVAVSVQLCAPDKRRRDIDNAGFKAIMDLLVKHQVIEGDDSRFVRAIEARWVNEGHACVVTIKPAIF